MANLGFPYFPNHFIILKSPPQQLQSSSSSSILILQKRLRYNTHDSVSLYFVSARTKSSSSSSSSSSLSSSSCGLPLEVVEEKALSPSPKFHSEELKSQKHQSLISLLRSFHFSDTHITKILIKYPRFRNSNVHTVLKPKLQFLSDYGFTGPLLADLIVLNPGILLRSLSDCIKPRLEFLEKYVQTTDKVVAAVRHAPRLLTVDFKNIMQPNIEFLISEGVAGIALEKLIAMQPRTLMVKLDKTVNAVETVKELGINPRTPTFVEAIRIIISLSDSTWERKVQAFKSFGWSEEDIMYAFKHYPACFACSEEKIRSIMDFYLNTMNLNHAVIVKNPVFLNYGLSSRIRPRYNVIKVLESKKLLKEDGRHHWLFTISEKNFLTTVVDKHLDQVPNLLELYRGTITGDNIDIQLH